MQLSFVQLSPLSPYFIPHKQNFFNEVSDHAPGHLPIVTGTFASLNSECLLKSVQLPTHMKQLKNGYTDFDEILHYRTFS
jgi:hypothetical protein